VRGGGVIAEASGGGIADLLGEGGGVEAGAVAGFLDEEAAGIFAVLENDEVAVRAGDAAESGGGEFGGGDVGGNGWSGWEAFRGWQGERGGCGVGGDLFEAGAGEGGGFRAPDAVGGIFSRDESGEVGWQRGIPGAWLGLSDAGDPCGSGDQCGGSGGDGEVDPTAASRAEDSRAGNGRRSCFAGGGWIPGRGWGGLGGGGWFCGVGSGEDSGAGGARSSGSCEFRGNLQEGTALGAAELEGFRGSLAGDHRSGEAVG